MLALPHYGEPEMARGGIAISIFPQHRDPEKAEVMKPFLILSPL